MVWGRTGESEINQKEKGEEGKIVACSLRNNAAKDPFYLFQWNQLKLLFIQISTILEDRYSF